MGAVDSDFVNLLPRRVGQRGHKLWCVSPPPPETRAAQLELPAIREAIVDLTVKISCASDYTVRTCFHNPDHDEYGGGWLVSLLRGALAFRLLQVSKSGSHCTRHVTASYGTSRRFKSISSDFWNGKTSHVPRFLRHWLYAVLYLKFPSDVTDITSVQPKSGVARGK